MRIFPCLRAAVVLTSCLALANTSWAQTAGALAELEALAANPDSAPQAFHGQRPSGSDAGVAGGSVSGAAKSLPAPMISAKPEVSEPRKPELTAAQKSNARSGAIKGGALGLGVGLITGGILAWGLGFSILGIIAGIAIAALSTYIGTDVGSHCANDPKCT